MKTTIADIEKQLHDIVLRYGYLLEMNADQITVGIARSEFEKWRRKAILSLEAKHGRDKVKGFIEAHYFIVEESERGEVEVHWYNGHEVMHKKRYEKVSGRVSPGPFRYPGPNYSRPSTVDEAKGLASFWKHELQKIDLHFCRVNTQLQVSLREYVLQKQPKSPGTPDGSYKESIRKKVRSFKVWMERNKKLPVECRKGKPAANGEKAEPALFYYHDLDARWEEHAKK